jgi:hypothetical protein
MDSPEQVSLWIPQRGYGHHPRWNNKLSERVVAIPDKMDPVGGTEGVDRWNHSRSPTFGV